MAEKMPGEVRGRGRGRGRGRLSETAPSPVGGDSAELAALQPLRTDSLSPDSATPVQSDGRQDQSPASLKMENLSLVSVMERPNFGQAGRPIKLSANYFDFKIGVVDEKKVGLMAHRYECLVENPYRMKIDREEKREIFWQTVSKYPNVFIRPTHLAYDDSNCLWTMEKLKLDDGGLMSIEIELMLVRDRRPSTYKVELKYTGAFLIDLRESIEPGGTSVAVQLIDCVTTQRLRCPLIEQSRNWYSWGRSMYRMPEPGGRFPPISLSGGREVWTGFHMAAKVGQGWKPLINVDVSHTAFTKRIPLLQFLCDVLNAAEKCRPGQEKFFLRDLNAETVLDERCRINLEKNLKGLLIKTTHMEGKNRSYRFNAVVPRSAESTKFQRTTEEAPISIAEYWEEKYFKLKYPKLPLLHLGPRQKNLFLPMECCSIADEPQKVMKKLTDDQTADLIRSAAKPADQRKQMIEALIASADYANDPFVNEFGMSMNLRMLELGGRVLPAPKLDFGPNRIIEPREGVWKADTKFAIGAEGICYSVVSLLSREYENMLGKCFSNLMQTCKNLGMQIDKDSLPVHVLYVGRNDDLKQKLSEATKKKDGDSNVNLVFVAMFTRQPDIYATIKAWGDVETGVMTQVLLKKNIENVSQGNPNTNATSQNIAMKLNAKMGGINNGISFAERVWTKFIREDGPTLFLGVDVTHPGVGDKNSPSIAAIVGNIDVLATKYVSRAKVQHRRMERVVYLVDVVKERLMDFYKSTKMKPSHIVVYRDGVSEGEFQLILQEEMMSVRKACADISKDYTPTITFVIVQKRHHTRFFVQNAADAVGRAKNIPPGTCVDTVITHPCEFDFYLCSHFGIQGTSRPTHYICLHDDWGLTADELQMITYQLCHVYARCARTVSIPAPVYYAHRACYRARSHNQHKFGYNGDSTERVESAAGGQSVASSERQLTEAVTIHENLAQAMYFV